MVDVEAGDIQAVSDTTGERIAKLEARADTFDKFILQDVLDRKESTEAIKRCCAKRSAGPAG